VSRRPERRKRADALQGAIDLRGMMLAVVVARTGSLRLAAREVGLAAPAASRRLRALEDGLGVSLFERRPSGMKPTAAGDDFLVEAARVLGGVQSATKRAREAGTATTGRLEIGTYFSASTGRLREALMGFVRQNRGVEVWLREGCRDDLVAAVRRGEVDLGLLLGPMEEQGLDRLGLWQEAGMVALPTEHGLASQPIVFWSDLVAETFIISRRGSGPEARQKVEASLPPNHKARFVVQDIGREAMFNLVGTGLGVAVLSESASGALYPGVVFRPVGDDTGPIMVEAAAYWDPKRDNPALRRFLALLRASQAPGSRGGG
jgi:DNA-binding transcriptional LysR family regulator